ncbi:Shikimate kinase I [Enterococcus mundtii 3F]|uniref:shikimate kinase n=1 Tax=Enterococcus mundtii TaxID=53346 RepID=UPI002302532C|nr:shikimate kinase [Enterococcus mundtii]MDA9460968.1 Shikimate kinase I [Enterococcus mundtii 3F]
MAAIVLIGFMGAGKTTISRKLSMQLKKPLIDMDTKLVEEFGCSISEYFESHGEAAFRQEETKLLKTSLQEEAIIATGGGVILQEENQRLLADHLVVYLKADPDLLIKRIRQDHKQARPLALDKDDTELKELFFSRKKHYETIADLTIETTGKSPAEIVSEIIKQVMNR